jgi:hypothetical protein
VYTLDVVCETSFGTEIYAANRQFVFRSFVVFIRFDGFSGSLAVGHASEYAH